MGYKPKNGHTGGPNPPDYVCPKRRERKPFTIYLPLEVKAAMLETARRNGLTMQEAGEQLCKAFVETAGQLLGSSKTLAVMDLPYGPSAGKSGGEAADASC
jgi:hypothetical protein